MTVRGAWQGEVAAAQAGAQRAEQECARLTSAHQEEAAKLRTALQAQVRFPQHLSLYAASAKTKRELPFVCKGASSGVSREKALHVSSFASLEHVRHSACPAAA